LALYRPVKLTMLSSEPPAIWRSGLKQVTHCMQSLLAALCAAVLVSQAHAQGSLQTHRISADRANQAVAAVVAKCSRKGYAETGALVDADGVQLAMLRGDRAGAHTLDSAYAEAYTSASFKTDTTALVERSKTVPVLATSSNCRICCCSAEASSSKWVTRWSERLAPPGRREAISTKPVPAPGWTRLRTSSSSGRAGPPRGAPRKNRPHAPLCSLSGNQSTVQRAGSVHKRESAVA
jgi:Haem degrading protein HbpS-like